MRYEISKEMLSLVLDENVRRVMFDYNEVYETYSEELEDNECLVVFGTTSFSSYLRINVDTLFFNCLDYLNKKGHKLSLVIDSSEELKSFVFAKCEEVVKEEK